MAARAEQHLRLSSALDMVCISRDSARWGPPSTWLRGVLGTGARLLNWRVRLTMHLAYLRHHAMSPPLFQEHCGQVLLADCDYNIPVMTCNILSAVLNVSSICTVCCS